MVRRVRGEAEDQEHWIPLSDLMTSLAFFFMAIAIAYIVQSQAHKDAYIDPADALRTTRLELYHALSAEFDADFARWHATLTPDLKISFQSPDVFFETGSADLSPKFKRILGNFFPRYLKILEKPEFHDSVRELRIDGFASRSDFPGLSEMDSFIANMTLSQERSTSSLNFLVHLSRPKSDNDWLLAHVSANGFSSSHPLLEAGRESISGSQRVEFNIVDQLDDFTQKTAFYANADTAANSDAVPFTITNGSVHNEPALTGKIFYSVDVIESPQEPALVVADLKQPSVSTRARDDVKVTGWAIDPYSRTPLTHVLLRIDGKNLVPAEYGTSRPDVGQYLQSAHLANVGFTLAIPGAYLPYGTHQCDLIFERSNGSAVIIPKKIRIRST
jgi:outer membrane protein OmpA-like peptidoglycan-associated protein